jgi:hypothetical protein
MQGIEIMATFVHRATDVRSTAVILLDEQKQTLGKKKPTTL